MGSSLSGGHAGLHRHGMGRNNERRYGARDIQSQVSHYRSGEQTHRGTYIVSLVNGKNGYATVYDIPRPDNGLREGTSENRNTCAGLQ